MLTTIRTYQNLRARGLSRAWEISGMPEVGDKLVAIVCWIVGIAGVLYLLSDYANAAQANQSGSAYTKSLENLVAGCLSEKGRAIQIGDEWFVCGIYPLGSFK